MARKGLMVWRVKERQSSYRTIFKGEETGEWNLSSRKTEKQKDDVGDREPERVRVTGGHGSRIDWGIGGESPRNSIRFLIFPDIWGKHYPVVMHSHRLSCS